MRSFSRLVERHLVVVLEKVGELIAGGDIGPERCGQEALGQDDTGPEVRAEDGAAAAANPLKAVAGRDDPGVCRGAA